MENQGRIALEPGAETISLIEAIAAAGGLTRLADLKKIVVRPPEGDPVEVDFRAILYGNADDAHLQPGTSVYVPERVF